jgi:hypothetical protein
MNDHLLGKKIVAPTPTKPDDEYETFKGIHGTKMLRNKRTGAIETAPPVKVIEAPLVEEDPAYPLVFWGTW